MTRGIPVRVGDPAGAYRRRLRTRVTAPGTVVADLEDDFHRFRVTCHHDGARVRAIIGESLRYPWSTCCDAAEPLHTLEGMPLSIRCTAVGDHGDPHANCTHMFDAAGLAVAHAARVVAGGAPVRQYDIELSPLVEGRQRPRLWRDGELLLEWTISVVVGGRGMVDPEPPFDRAPWRGGFIRWADEHLAPDDAEPAIVLRRACDIGMGRGMDLEAFETADELSPIMSGVCYTMQREHAPDAHRNRGTIRDFAADPDALLADGDYV